MRHLAGLLRTKRLRGVLLAALLAATLAPLAAQAAPTPAAACGTAFPRYSRPAVAGSSSLLSDVPITMSDGVVLRADITLPVGVRGKRPTVLTITGYGKSTPISTLGGGTSDLVAHGYATMLLDDRGTGASGGSWDAWSQRTVADYREVLDWIVKQPWSDGRIALSGGSYMGITALYAAASGSPAVKAVFATVPMADAYRDIVFGGGQINTAFIPLWMGLVTGLGLLPNATPSVLADHVVGLAKFQVPTVVEAATGGGAATDGPFWRQRSPIEVVDKITAPTFIVGGLDDIFQRGEPLLYEHLARHTDARLLIGPWTHITAATGLPRDGVPTTGSLMLQWFDQHVLGLAAKAECVPHVTQFVRGHERYESAPTWPVPGLAAQRWNLRSDHTLTTAAPGPRERGRDYLELPTSGICTRSTDQWLIGLIDTTPCATDNELDEIGKLTYTTAPVTTESLINGPIEADLWVSTQSPDASVSVSISDVAPDGTSRGLTNGLLTASQRLVDPSRARLLDGQSIQPWHPFTTASRRQVPAGQPMLLRIEVFPTSDALLPGHRLRVTISPFDVPHALPPLGDALNTVGGRVTVLSDAAHPSSIVLPVVTRAAG
jgi:putative CocE/NonD family hydrolase